MRRWQLRSPCDRYRWVLGRRWDDAPVLLVIGLNPATADHTGDDPTTRRCIDFARRWGHGGMWLVNLYGWRTPYPKRLFADGAPEGGPNRVWLHRAHRAAGRTLAAWGNHGLGPRADALRRDLPELWVLGLTKPGAPRHPLYVRADTPPRRWDDLDPRG